LSAWVDPRDLGARIPGRYDLGTLSVRGRAPSARGFDRCPSNFGPRSGITSRVKGTRSRTGGGMKQGCEIRGSLTILVIDEALAGWKAQPRMTPGGQARYSDLAVEPALTLRAVFRLALRQSDRLIGSIMRTLEIDLPVPDNTTLSRRVRGSKVVPQPESTTCDLHRIVDSTGLKLRGAGEWLIEKHGSQRGRSGRQLGQVSFIRGQRRRRVREPFDPTPFHAPRPLGSRLQCSQSLTFAPGCVEKHTSQNNPLL
jgi:Transposase DDE domain